MAEKTGMQYEYDVAISFLKQDESLALRLKDELAPLRVFVYSKAQEELAGTDGLESFREVFRSRCRVALVLYRTGWGDTRWTRVEAAAIKDLCFNEGLEHVLLVRLERSAQIPGWVPDSYLYLDFETFGITDLVGAAKAKCAKLGVELRAPSAADEARKIARAARFKEETQAARSSSPAPFHEAANILYAALDQALDELASGTGWELVKGRSPTYVYVAAARGVSFQLLPRELYLNTSRDAYLLFRIFSGRLVTYDEESRGLRPTFPPTQRFSDELRLERTETLGWCWSHAGLKPRANQEIASYIVKTFVGAMDGAEIWFRE